MNDMNVSLRLQLRNDLSKEAERAERDLKSLESALKKLDGSSNRRLGENIAGIRREADKSENAVKKLAAATGKLGAAGGTDKLEKNVRDIARAAQSTEKAINEVGAAARKLGSVNTDKSEKEIRSVGQAARDVQKDITELGKKMGRVTNFDGGKLDKLAQPTRNLDTTLGSLARNAGAAIGSLMAFASVDNIVRGIEQLTVQYRKLNREVASVAVTAEMRTPQAVEKISQSNEKLSIRYGIDQSAVNDTRKTYAAAGFGLDQQEDILNPTLKAAKAGDSTGETMAQAVIAAQQALGVKNGEVPAALDMMAKGSKLGSFEVDAMARNFPALATMYGGTGRQGLQGWGELIALAQVVRMGAGTQDQAATNLQNIISKLSAPETVKNFEEFEVNGVKKGVSLPDLRKKSEQNGTPYMMDLIDQVMKMTGGDEFLIGELFGDMQAKQALAPLMNNRETYEAFLKQILGDSSGTVDQDYDFLRNLPQEQADRRGAALQATGDKVGRTADFLTNPVRERIARTVNPDYGAQESAYEHERLKSLGAGELRRRLIERSAQLGDLPSEMFDFIPAFSAARQSLQNEIEKLRAAMADLPVADGPVGSNLGRSRGDGYIPIPQHRPSGDPLTGGPSLEERDERKRDQPSGWKRFLFGKAADADFSLKDHMGIDLRGTAQKSMGGYNEALAAEGDKAAQEAQTIAERIKSALGFTVSPVISPTFVNPGGVGGAQPAGTGEKQSSLSSSQSSNVKLTQNISSPNSRVAALRAQREADRSVRMAQSRAFSDMGPRTA